MQKEWNPAPADWGWTGRDTHVSAPAHGGWPPAGETSAVDNAPGLVIQRDLPDEVVAVRLRPEVHHLVPA